MRYWLFKSEPSTWSWADQVARGAAGEEWDGVRNYQARNFMREMAVGDRGFFYHSQKEKAVVGTVEVIAAAHPDSTTDDPRWECVDIRALEAAQTPVTLDEIKGRSAPVGHGAAAQCAPVGAAGRGGGMAHHLRHGRAFCLTSGPRKATRPLTRGRAFLLITDSAGCRQGRVAWAG